MKNLLFAYFAGFLITTTTAAAQPAFQAGADQFNEIIRCQPLVLQPDVNISVSVEAGGYAGLTQVKVSRTLLGRTTSESYIVKALTRPEAHANEGITYVSSEIRMTVNFNTTYGMLKIRENGSTSTTELSCELILQNPQVNYVY